METIQIDAIVKMLRQANAKLAPKPTVEQLRESSNALHDCLPVSSGVHFTKEVEQPGIWTTLQVSKQDAVILYLHGGGYVLNTPNQYKTLTAELCLQTGTDVFAIDYRRAPEAPFPAALEDAFSTYQWLLKTRPGAAIVVAGDSAGGGLAVSLMLYCKEKGVALPTAAFLISPWVDLTLSASTLASKLVADPAVSPTGLEFFASQYAKGTALENPLVSPLFGDLHGLPPMLVHVGSEEVLLDDAVRLAGKAGAAQVDVTLKVWPHMIHKWHVWHSCLLEGEAALRSAAAFIREHLDEPNREDDISASIPLS